MEGEGPPKLRFRNYPMSKFKYYFSGIMLGVSAQNAVRNAGNFLEKPEIKKIYERVRLAIRKLIFQIQAVAPKNLSVFYSPYVYTNSLGHASLRYFVFLRGFSQQKDASDAARLLFDKIKQIQIKNYLCIVKMRYIGSFKNTQSVSIIPHGFHGKDDTPLEDI